MLKDIHEANLLESITRFDEG